MMRERVRWAVRRLLAGVYAPTSVIRLRRRRPVDIKRIAVVRPDHLGDLLFATPALARLRKAFPGAHITGLVGPWGKAMWEGNPDLDRVQTLPFPGIAGRAEGGPLAPYALLGKAARRVAWHSYDLGVVMRFDHWWGAALLAAAGVPHVWGYDTPGMRPWLTGRVPYVSGRHEVEQDLSLVQAVVEGLPARAQGLPTLHVDRDRGVPPLRPPGARPPEVTPDEWLAVPWRLIVHPGTGAANKLWTIGGWAEVISRLLARGWAVALTGSPSERKLADAIVSAMQPEPGTPLYNLAGQTSSLTELTWVLDQARMVLGVDSGPLHIAAALGKPTLHLYGPSDETIWGPWGDPCLHVAYRAPGTHPTMRLEVGSTALEGGPEMRAITVEMVMDETEKLVRESDA